LVSNRGEGCYEVPEGAEADDVRAQEWWWNGPSVPVGSGDSPESAVESLLHQLDAPDKPRFGVGAPVTVGPAPDFWYHDGTGRVVGTVREQRLGRHAPAGSGQWEYVVEFADGERLKIPEPYLRLVTTD